MSFRGRGRGRGRGQFGGAKQLPFELFPEIEGLGTSSDVKEAKNLAVWYSKFEKYYKSSPYFIEDANDGSKKNVGTEIDTYSNRDSNKNKPKPRLSDFINMDPEYVPAELAKGDKKGRHISKRVRWNPRSDTLQLEDLFTKKLQEHKELQEHQMKEGKAKKEGGGEEEENEDERNEDDEEEGYSSDDYNKNDIFDDDEDDYNMADVDNDEPEL